MIYPRISLKPGREKSLFFRHPWIFSGAIAKKDADISDGAIVEVVDQQEKFLARGYYNSRSNIAIRVLTFEPETIDEHFIADRLKKAWNRRKDHLDSHTNALRMVFAEADGLPGLVVDKYADHLVLQFHTLGMEVLKDIVIKAIIDLFKPTSIFERSDIAVRKKEGLMTMPKGLLYGEFQGEKVLIEEHGVKFYIDIENGQKTGFFLDQRENRQSLGKYVRDKKVLNLFSYTGGFSCYALKFGAEHVTSVDISEPALKICEENIKLNKFLADGHNRHSAIAEDGFVYLEKAFENKQQFEVIIVDPPAFVKSQKKLNNAINAYIKLNEAALKVLAPGGIFITSSCSGFVTQEMFRSVIFQAALRANKILPTELILLEQKIQPFDHPLTINFPEGEYLKFFVLQKI